MKAKISQLTLAILGMLVAAPIALICFAAPAYPMSMGTSGGTGTAQVVSSPAQLSLTVTSASGSGKSLSLTATTSTANAPSGPIHFYVATGLFGGQKLVPLGTVNPTDGTATLTYVPTWTGNETFVAKVLDSASGKALTTGTDHFLVTSAQPAVTNAAANPAKPLATFGKGMVVVLGAIVIAVWLTLLITIVRVVRGVRTLAA